MQGTEDQALILNKKFKVIKKIGSGSFGYIYKCVSLSTEQMFAVKIEKKGKGEGQLKYEIRLYQLFQGINGIAQLHDYGYQEDKLFMVIDLLEMSLEELLQAHSKKFSLSTVFQIGIQIIKRLEGLHRKGFLHRDIKANNFMIGKNESRSTVFIIDFGLAKKYKDSKTGLHIPFKAGKSLVGTARYASIASHLGHQQGRKDDLESLGFLLLYFLNGKLPWQGVQIKNKIQKYAEIGRIKRQSQIEQMCLKSGEHAYALVKYFKQVRSLNFVDQPPYQILKNIFSEQLIKMKQETQPLDWISQ